MASPQTLSEADSRIVAGWAADCAQRVLWLFEAQAPGDSRPRDAIARTRAFARGERDVAEEIRQRFVGGAAAREVATPSAAAAAKAAGQAAAIPRMGAHAPGAAAYAAKAAGLAAPDRPDAVTVESLDGTDRDAFLALGDRHDISDIVHLAGSIPDEDPVGFFRTDTIGLLNALDAARTWDVRRFAVASSLGVYVGRTEIPWHEELALPTAALPHLIIAFKKAVEPLTTHGLQGSGVQPVVLRIGTIWGPLVDPESPFFYIPPYISAVLRGDQPQPLYADDGGDYCYAPDAGRAIALLTTAKGLEHDTYNVSSGRPFTNREFADALQPVAPGLELDLLPGRQGGPGKDPYLDITRLARDTGFAPHFDVNAAVADYVAWRAHNPR